MSASATALLIELYDTHVDTVYRYIHRRCRDHSLAEDITQETFIAACGRPDGAPPVTVGWLLTVARNRLFDVLRRQTRFEEKLRLVAAADTQVIDIAERIRVETVLDELPVHYRLVLTLHYINGLTVREIASELDRSTKSVEGLMTRARRAFSDVFDIAPPGAQEGGHR